MQPFRYLALVLLLFMPLLADSHREDFHMTYPLSAGGRVEVQNFNGSIEISGWDQETVDISGTKYADSESRLKDLKVDVQRSAGSVSIRSIRTEGQNWFGNQGIKYVLRVPRRALLARIVSSNGAIRVTDIEGDSFLRTSNGAITADVRNGALEASTSNGAIKATLAEGATKPAALSTSNGRIEVFMNASHPVHARSSNGSITVRMPEAVGAELSAHTSNGGVSSAMDVRGGSSSKHHRDGTIGAGGPRGWN